MRIRLVVYCVIALFLNAGLHLSAEEKQFSADEVALLAKLLGDTWTEPDITTLFSQSNVFKLPKMISLNVLDPIRLSKKKYHHFLEPYAINKAKRFINKWTVLLEQADVKYRVDKYVIVGILLLETSFGRFLGRNLILSVLASTLVDASSLLSSQQPAIIGVANQQLRERIQRKRSLALRELKALLTLHQRKLVDALLLKGSYAGAFGLAQFLPSSYLRWAADGNDDGKKDLFSVPDAVFSVARYLSANGYQNDNDQSLNYKAIWHYNNSDVYVDIVFAVALKLRMLYR